MKRHVVLGLLGSTLDAGVGARRWESWRPSVALCQHEDLLVSRFELPSQRQFAATAATVRKGIARVSPETEVRLDEMAFGEACVLEVVYGALQRVARAYPFDPDGEEYLFHIPTGPHVSQICMFLLPEARCFPARLLPTAPPARHQ